MTDRMIAAAMSGYLVRDSQQIALGPLDAHARPRGLALSQRDRCPRHHAAERRAAAHHLGDHHRTGTSRGWATTSCSAGLGFSLGTALPDTHARRLDLRRLAGVPLDVPATERLVFDTYRYADLLDAGARRPRAHRAERGRPRLALPPALLVYAYPDRGDRKRHGAGAIR